MSTYKELADFCIHAADGDKTVILLVADMLYDEFDRISQLERATRVINLRKNQ